MIRMCKNDFFGFYFEQLHGHKKLGIIRKGKGDVAPQYYNFTRLAHFEQKYNLFLRSVTPEDSGTYECAVSANVGGINYNPRVNLWVNGKLCISFTSYLVEYMMLH